ncbi:MAG: hypothetical protein ACRC1H_19210, partial [Caldilineaceae bacterium]
AQCGNEAPTVDAAIGIEVDGALQAGVYFDGYTENNIFAHIASSMHTLPRSLLRAVAVYVFEQLKLSRMTFAVSSGNHAAVLLVTRMGAGLEAMLRGACGAHNLNLYTLWADAPFARRILEMSETDHG